MNSQCLQPGTVLVGGKRPYTIVRVLGSGSFGITYLAVAQTSEGNISEWVKCAIKEHFMLSCFRGKDGMQVLCTPTARKMVKDSRDAFLKEARLLKQICQKERGIVNVNETFEANGTAYYVMEYLDGGNPGKMPEKKAIELIVQVARALQSVHNEKILHLDLKPANIVMNTDKDGKIYPVLIDFGIAKHFDNSGQPTSQIMVKGATPGYAPLEQYAGIQKFTPNIDIYALGAVFLYLLTGKNPPSPADIDLDQKQIKDMLPSGVSARTRATILHAMCRSAIERTPDIPSFLADLGIETNVLPNGNINEVADLQIKETRKIVAVSIVCTIIILGLLVTIYILKLSERPNVSRIIPQNNNAQPMATQLVDRSIPNTISAADGFENDFAWVDLGLPSGVKWATLNIGATSPEDYGDYFAWGEVSPKKEYTIDTSQIRNISSGDFAGNSQYDAAAYNWGAEWRMPRYEDYRELRDNCRFEATKIGDSVGIMVISKINGKSIFLPAAGFCYGSSVTDIGERGYYWSSTSYNNSLFRSRGLGFDGSNTYTNVDYYRYYGRSIRPVVDSVSRGEGGQDSVTNPISQANGNNEAEEDSRKIS